MKPLLIWLAVVAVIFGGYALVANSLRETSQVFVFVDSSNPMVQVWRKVTAELDDIDDRENSEFALAYGRDQGQGAELVHSWQPTLELVGVEPFGLCSFADIDTFPEATEADERILITTTATSCDTTTLTDWTIIALEP
jgi:hypothetical protein